MLAMLSEFWLIFRRSAYIEEYFKFKLATIELPVLAQNPDTYTSFSGTDLLINQTAKRNAHFDCPHLTEEQWSVEQNGRSQSKEHENPSKNKAKFLGIFTVKVLHKEAHSYTLSDSEIN